MNTETTYSVLDSAAKMPRSCWGRYRRVAVVEHEVGNIPAMISERVRGCVRIVATWEKLNVGTTERCAYQLALKEANELCDELIGGKL